MRNAAKQTESQQPDPEPRKSGTPALLDKALAALDGLADAAVRARLDGLNVEGDPIEVSLTGKADETPEQQQQLVARIQAALQPLSSKSVRVHFTAMRTMRSMRTMRNAGKSANAANVNAKAKAGKPSADAPPLYNPQAIAGVKAVVAVASAKGGVGKSTVAANLALALQRLGWRTGLADLDLFGPSTPLLFGTAQKPALDADGRLLPLDAAGVALISAGLLVPPGQPLAMRGPMVQKTLLQLLFGVRWPTLDLLLLDLPPGTGDVPLSLAQKVAVDGALIVSTPQDLALSDVRRGVALFETVKLPVLGFIENMAQFTCPHCGSSHRLFGEGGVAEIAQALDKPLLASLPLLPDLQGIGEAREPLLASDSDGPAAQAFLELAARVQALLTG